MTYQEFKKQYQDAFNKMMSYSPKEVGASHYASVMANLADNYPDFAEMAENEG